MNTILAKCNLPLDLRSYAAISFGIELAGRFARNYDDSAIIYALNQRDRSINAMSP
jgi:hypothetical protein